MIFGPEYTPPESWQKCAEKRELFRSAAASALAHSDDGRALHPTTRLWAKHWAAMPALTVPLTSGEPA
jgi:hypothetical protein